MMNYFNSQDPLNKFCVIMGISQLGEYLLNGEENFIYNSTSLLVQALEDESPLVRFAALHCIGQLSDDLKPEYQEHTHDLLIPKILKRYEDEVPRVQSHATAALTNYVEELDDGILQKYGNEIYTKTLAKLDENPISLIKENSVSVLSCFGQFNGFLSKE